MIQKQLPEVFYKKMFLKILQNTEEDIRAGVIFIIKYASSL